MTEGLPHPAHRPYWLLQQKHHGSKTMCDRMHVSTAISNVRFMSVSDVTLMHYVTDVLAVDSIAGSRYGR